MNYEQTTDFEINKAVADSLGFEIFAECDDWFSVLRYSGVGGGASKFDPCNDPSDAWPVILENKITIQAPDNGILNTSDDEWCADGYYYYLDDCMSASYSDKNPLRAAMIVYLMMQESNA